MINDYYNDEELDRIFEDFYRSLNEYGENNIFHDPYLRYLEIPQDVKEKNSLNYEIDSDAYLFYLVRFFGLQLPNRRKLLLKHPHIQSLKVESPISHLKTDMGEVDFKYWINGIPDLIKMTFQNFGYAPLLDSFHLFHDEYTGKYNGRCHEASIQFSGPNDVVTAFIRSPLSGLSYLHSFVESDKKVLETTANIVMDREDYYRLSKPDVITKIPGEELFEIWESYFQKYPRLKHMSLKQLLVEYDEVKKNPEAIKIKTFRDH